MANIAAYLQAISEAVLGEEVRGSIHDAIDIINKSSEKTLTLGTAITATNSPISGYYLNSLYLNTSTWDLWKCNGIGWSKEGNLKGSGVSRITKTSTSGSTDTYTMYNQDNQSLGTFNVTNGINGTNGAPGSKIGIGNGVTSTNTSVTVDGITYISGDFYINNTTWTLWYCTGSAWENKGSLKAADGINGTNGRDGVNGVDGVSPTITAARETGANNTVVTITDVNGSRNFVVYDGTNGINGVSPVISGGRVPDTNQVVITITDATGPHSFTLYDGANGTNGTNGTDGVSPVITSNTKSGKVTTLVITDANGPHTITINDGNDGSGTGDMVMATYDSNQDGVVNQADRASSVPWSGVENKPTIPVITVSDTDLTPGVSQLATGTLYFVYE